MKRIKKILFYADDGAPDPVALERSIRYAKGLEASLALVAVVKPVRSQVLLASSTIDLDKVEQILVDEQAALLEASTKGITDNGVPCSVKVLIGDPVVSIIREVIAEGYDALMKAPSPAQGLRQQLLGSIDMRLMRACPCVVAVVRNDKPQMSGRVVLAVDYAPSNDLKARLNESILHLAVQVKTYFDQKELYLLHAWTVYENRVLSHARGISPGKALGELREAEKDKRREWISGLVNDFQQSLDDPRVLPFDPKVELLYGDPVEAIPRKLSEIDADFVVIGTISRTGASGLLIGNTAEEILSRVSCSVVAIKPEDFVSPVSITS